LDPPRQRPSPSPPHPPHTHIPYPCCSTSPRTPTWRAWRWSSPTAGPRTRVSPEQLPGDLGPAEMPCACCAKRPHCWAQAPTARRPCRALPLPRLPLAAADAFIAARSDTTGISRDMTYAWSLASILLNSSSLRSLYLHNHAFSEESVGGPCAAGSAPPLVPPLWPHLLCLFVEASACMVAGAACSGPGLHCLCVEGVLRQCGVEPGAGHSSWGCWWLGAPSHQLELHAG
jgi:hypothetical protein